MSPVAIVVFLAASGLAWHLLARGRQRESQDAHRAIAAGQARFWAARLQADDARGAADPAAADARLHECARQLAATRARVADLAGGASAPAATERLHAAQEELRRMQESMLAGALEPAGRRRAVELVGRLRSAAGPEAAAAPSPARSPRYGEPDALERAIRFTCGFFFGVGLAFLLTLQKPLATDGGNLAVMAAAAGVCGLMAMRFGDGFWYWISANLEWIWRWARR
ncbi:MAG TPA: hypothetical protein VF615_08030 [Longimicrobiaceae bacterium]|jgi:hypothetical protein